MEKEKLLEKKKKWAFAEQGYTLVIKDDSEEKMSTNDATDVASVEGNSRTPESK